MSEILAVTGPIYILIATGYLAGRLGWFSKPDMRILGKFVISFALPALLFKALSQRSLQDVMNSTYLLAYATGSLLVLVLGIALARFARGHNLQHSTVYAMGMSLSNSGFIGYPILLQLLGPPAAVALALTMVVENVLILPLALIIADCAGGEGEKWHRVMRVALHRLVRNPLILSILGGLLFALLQIRLPAPLLRAVDLLALASSAVALFVIGGSLVGLQLSGLRSDIALVATGKLLLHPLAVLAALLVLPPLDPQLRTAALLFACMPMFSIYPILGQKYHMEGFSAATLLATTVVSFLTISTILWLVGAVQG